MKPFYIFNSLSRAVEEFQPLNPPEVTLYSCGPTVYLPQHLGNLRAYVFVDRLRRALEFNGYKVRHVMNVTDVGHMTSDEDAGEDKIEKTARAQGKSPLEVANFYLEQFQRDCATLNLELPHRAALPRDRSHRRYDRAHRKNHRRRLRLRHAPACTSTSRSIAAENRVGRLSRQSLDEQDAAQRLEHSADKHSPHDFTLWVLDQPDHLMQWDSPWGRGYPGWHIECSAMSMKYLGETIDIHTGGIDHIPVHHENEIAQSESATHKPFARYFVHNAFLVGKEGTKISKSAGKFPLLSDLVTAGIDPLAFRIFCLRREVPIRDCVQRRCDPRGAEQSRLFSRVRAQRAGRRGCRWRRGRRMGGGVLRALSRRDQQRSEHAAGDSGGSGTGRGSIPAQGSSAWTDAARRSTRCSASTCEASRGRHRRVPDRSRRAAADRQSRARRARPRTSSCADELRKEIERRGYEVKDNRDGTATYQASRLSASADLSAQICLECLRGRLLQSRVDVNCASPQGTDGD